MTTTSTDKSGRRSPSIRIEHGPISERVQLVLVGAPSKLAALARARSIRARHPYGSRQWTAWNGAVWFLENVVDIERENGFQIEVRK